MLERIRQTTPAQRLFIAAVVVALFITYNVVLAITRIGEIKVSVNVIPKNAEVTVNGKPSSKRTLYLSPAKYTFVASAEGWKTDTQAITVSKTVHDAYLLPSPSSQQAQNLLKNDPKLQQERETLGGERVDLQNQEALKQNPILKYLPYTQDSPPFTIDFGPSNNGNGDMLLLVSNSSPNGRQAAIDWIRQHGEDPTNMQIIFSDFISPLDATTGDNDGH